MIHQQYAPNVRSQPPEPSSVVELGNAQLIAGCEREASLRGFESQLKRILTTSRDVLVPNPIVPAVTEIHLQNASALELAAIANTRSLLTKM
jgi:hypothetical protein